MDFEISENKASRPLRRSTRSSHKVSVLSFEPTPRAPLKRTKKRADKQAPVAAVNGSGDTENGSEDDDSPSKKLRVTAGGEGDGSGDENEMDVQESAEEMERGRDQEMDMERQDSPHSTHPPKIYQGATGDVNFFPRVVLHDRCRTGPAQNKDADVVKTMRVTPLTKGLAAPTKHFNQVRSLENRRDVLIPKVTSMEEYNRTMKAKAAIDNHLTQRKYPASEKSYTTQRLNNTPIQKEVVQHKKKEGIKKAAAKRSSGHCCREFMWYLWSLALLLLLSWTALLASNKIPVLQRMADLGGHSSRAVKPEEFVDQLSHLEALFPSQRCELWRWSKIHLEKHLKTAHPTEPVSLILTAGRRAERTLRCLAQGLASSFSSALNASVLHIDGASKAAQHSDEVKMDIDDQLKAAFEGDKPVAVIHRLEELPPGSTLIFYRYCDHESAAYKRVFLLFTVLLPQDEVSSERSLREVEEMVQDYVKERLVGSGSQTSFNKMDIDKYGGLWSRISHLILPVVSEKETEQKGC